MENWEKETFSRVDKITTSAPFPAKLFFPMKEVQKRCCRAVKPGVGADQDCGPGASYTGIILVSAGF